MNRPLETPKIHTRNKDGFTLVELIVVVAIIGILASIAIPQFAGLISKGQEATTKGNLASLRSALSIYYSDTEGHYPYDDLTSLSSNSKYLSAIPAAKLPAMSGYNTGHPDNSVVATPSVTDAGGWSYDNSGDANFGTIVVNCMHSDSKGISWSSY
jgi:general secretion pathway protein G